MLSTTLTYKDVFARLKQHESSHKILPSDRDWILVKEMCDKLKLFYAVTEMFSGTKYPTSNLYFPKVSEIRLLLDDCLLSNVKEISDMAANMVGKFEKYWMVIHGLLAMATILDPRFKLKLIEYYFPKIYDNDSEKEIGRVKKMCYDLVNENQVKYFNYDCTKYLQPAMLAHFVHHGRVHVRTTYQAGGAVCNCLTWRVVTD